MISFILLLKLAKIWEFAKHLLNTDIIPLFAFVTAKLGEDLRYFLVLVGNHVLGSFRDINDDI